MGVPLRQQIAVGTYLIKQKLKGVKKYPLVLMLEPLFRCNLECAGCGKIAHPEDVLDQLMNAVRRWFQFLVANHCCTKKCRKSLKELFVAKNTFICVPMHCY